MGREQLRMATQAFQWLNYELKKKQRVEFLVQLIRAVHHVPHCTCMYEHTRHTLPTVLALPLGAYLALP